jgi:hypothetical protein
MLPKIQQPIFTIFLPISKKTIKCRPMVVREEKMLLVAKESKELQDIVNNLAAVISNCIVDSAVNVYDLPLVEFEYIFVMLRSKSISEQINLKYYDTYDKKIIHDVNIDVNKIKITIPEKFNTKIMLTDTMGIMMKLPTLSVLQDIDYNSTDEVQVGVDMVSKSIDYIFDSEQVYKVDEYTTEEIENFIEDLSIESFQKIEEYFKHLPSMKYTTSYKNSKGEDVSIELSRLEDFF